MRFIVRLGAALLVLWVATTMALLSYATTWELPAPINTPPAVLPSPYGPPDPEWAVRHEPLSTPQLEER